MNLLIIGAAATEWILNVAHGSIFSQRRWPIPHKTSLKTLEFRPIILKYTDNKIIYHIHLRNYTHFKRADISHKLYSFTQGIGCCSSLGAGLHSAGFEEQRDSNFLWLWEVRCSKAAGVLVVVSSSPHNVNARPLYIVDYENQKVLINGHHDPCSAYESRAKTWLTGRWKEAKGLQRLAKGEFPGSIFPNPHINTHWHASFTEATKHVVNLIENGWHALPIMDGEHLNSTDWPRWTRSRMVIGIGEPSCVSASAWEHATSCDEMYFTGRRMGLLPFKSFKRWGAKCCIKTSSIQICPVVVSPSNMI